MPNASEGTWARATTSSSQGNPASTWPCAVVDVNQPIKAKPSTAAVNTNNPQRQLRLGMKCDLNSA